MSELVDDLDVWGFPEDSDWPPKQVSVSLCGIYVHHTAKAICIHVTTVGSPLFGLDHWFPFSQISIQSISASGVIEFTLKQWLLTAKQKELLHDSTRTNSK